MFAIRYGVEMQGGAQLSRYTGRQGRLTLPPISEETDKEKKGDLLAVVPTEANPQPTVPSGSKLREGKGYGVVYTKHNEGDVAR